MSTRTWTDDDVHNLMALMLRTLRMEGAKPVAALPISEVAQACGFAPSSLLKDCQADKFEHCLYGNVRSMTPAQVEKFLAKVTRGGDYAVTRPQPSNEMDIARAVSRKAASRKTARRVA